MKYPKLKNALLCRILTYVVVIGGALLPIIVVFCLEFVPDVIKALVAVGALIALVLYLFHNFTVLICLDVTLASLHCHNTARTRYDLPRRQSGERIEKSISRFGTKCTPAPIMPQPTELRYRFQSPQTVFFSGIEKVVAAYHVNYLNAEQYRAIFYSAKTNSKALLGKKKARFLDRTQKAAPLNRVTVMIIFARKVDEDLSNRLYELVCKQCGDEYEDAIVPCVIDLEKWNCVFNSLRLPDVGFGYPAKNRGIRIVKRLVFGGRIQLTGNDCFLPPIKDTDSDESLWGLWKMLQNEVVLSERKARKRFSAMADREIVLEGSSLYLKWGDRGICLLAEPDALGKKAKLEAVHCWTYPKANPIAKKTIQTIEQTITNFFAKKGYAVTFSDEQVQSES